MMEEGLRTDRISIDDVPEEIEDLGEVVEAMYTVLKQNSNKTFESWELTEEIAD